MPPQSQTSPELSGRDLLPVPMKKRREGKERNTRVGGSFRGTRTFPLLIARLVIVKEERGRLKGRRVHVVKCHQGHASCVARRLWFRWELITVGTRFTDAALLSAPLTSAGGPPRNRPPIPFGILSMETRKGSHPGQRRE